MEFITAENFADFIAHIHDKIFKIFFQRTSVIRECLTTFCPKNVVDTLDLTQLKLHDTNFVTKNLKEHFSDVIYETYLKDYPDSLRPDTSKKKQRHKKEAKVVLITDHKSSVDNYLSLFLQLIKYKYGVLMQDLEEGREPSIVLAIIINNGKKPLSTTTFQDCYKFLPESLKEYVLQMKLIIVNVQELKREMLLKMQGSSLLRSLFLSYQVVQSKKEKDEILNEIFKFMVDNSDLQSYFQPILIYLLQESTFKKASIDKTIDYYLTPQQKGKMVAPLGHQWLAEGKAEGITLGKAEGKKEGKKENARLIVLRGYYRGYSADALADLSLLPMEEVELLAQGFNTLKKAVRNKNRDIATLAELTQLSEEDVSYVLTCLDAQ